MVSDKQEVSIQVLEDGPLLVQGPVDLIDHAGRRIHTTKQVIALCRCGGSVTKPFCDGTHSKIGFQGAIKAVDEAESQD
jgi:CDGSH-type Zn-finger protein